MQLKHFKGVLVVLTLFESAILPRNLYASRPVKHQQNTTQLAHTVEV